jgi:hypothetical protein
MLIKKKYGYNPTDLIINLQNLLESELNLQDIFYNIICNNVDYCLSVLSVP